jgi:hypothetical protein
MENPEQDKTEQILLAEKLQLKWLKRMDVMFDEGTITSTDMATLARVLMANGWVLDPAQLPQKLRGKLAGSIPEPDAFDALPLRIAR